MAQKWTTQAGTQAGDRLAVFTTNAVQLSDGTLVWLELDGVTASNPTTYLKWTSDRSTLHTIDSWLQSSTARPVSTLSNGTMTICVDSSDNIYVVGTSNFNSGIPTAMCYVKGSGHSWTAQTMLTGASEAATIDGMAAAWCNTGGGTNSKGHLAVAICPGSGNATVLRSYDAGALQAGSGTLAVNSASLAASNGLGNIDLETDGLGGTALWTVFDVSTSSVRSYYATVSGAGAVSTTNLGTSGTGTLAGGTYNGEPANPTKIRLVRTSAGICILLVPSSTTSGVWTAKTFSTTAAVSTADCGTTPTVTNWANNSPSLLWDVFQDPLATRKVWVITNISQTQVCGLAVTCDASGGTVTWDTAGTTQDTGLPFQTGVSDIKAVKHPGAAQADWMVFGEYLTSPATYEIAGDYTSFQSNGLRMVV